MKPLCAWTIKGVIKRLKFIAFIGVILLIYRNLRFISDVCADDESECTKLLWMYPAIIVGALLFLSFAVLIRRRLVGRF